MQKGKMAEEALKTPMKRREVKGKGEKERYAHLNTVFQRIARRDKKAFLSEQCKEIEGKIHSPEALTKMGPERALTKM